MQHKILSLAVVSLLSISVQSSVQAEPEAPAVPAAPPVSAPAETPESVAQKSFEATKANRLEDSVKMMHPDELKRFQDSMLIIVEAAAKKGKDKQILQLFDGAPDVAALKKLDPVQFSLSYQKGMAKGHPEVAELFQKTTYKMIGPVMEGDSTAHCVYRLITPEFPITNVVSLKKQGDGWGTMLAGDAEKMIWQMNLALVSPPADPTKIVTTGPFIQTLGHVFEGADTAYVVYRAKSGINGRDLNKIYYMTVKKTDPEFAILQKNDKTEIDKVVKKKLGAK